MLLTVSVWAVGLLSLSCASAPYEAQRSPLMGPPARFQTQPAWRGSFTGGYSRFNQSCGVACGAPIDVSTGEILAPTAARGAQVLQHVVEATETLQGFVTVSRFLDAAQKGAVEDILQECVREANRSVDDEVFGKGRSLPDSECGKEPIVRDKLAPTWARHLGILKHAAAFACIQSRLAERFPENFKIEPRLRQDAFTKDVMLTDRRLGSLVPDIVIHFTRVVTRIQCIYDLKFSCGYAVGSNPWSQEVAEQMDSYGQLGGGCPTALVTPQMGIVRK